MKTYIGIDLGSTTTKAVLMDDKREVLGRGITNSRSNYETAARVAKLEAVIDTRLTLCRRTLKADTHGNNRPAHRTAPVATAARRTSEALTSGRQPVPRHLEQREPWPPVKRAPMVRPAGAAPRPVRRRLVRRLPVCRLPVRRGRREAEPVADRNGLAAAVLLLEVRRTAPGVWRRVGVAIGGCPAQHGARFPSLVPLG